MIILRKTGQYDFRRVTVELISSWVAPPTDKSMECYACLICCEFK